MIAEPELKQNHQCAICGGALTILRLRHTEPDRFERHLGIGGDEYYRDWIECGACGSCTNVMEPANAARLAALAEGYYEVDFASATITDKFAKVMALPEGQSDNAGRVARVSSRLDRWRAEVGCASDWVKVLDIGAGTGVFLARLLQTRGGDAQPLDAVALEPDPTAAAHLRSLGGFNVVEGVFDPVTVGSGFGLVTLNKVIEHVPAPLAFLREVSKALDPVAGLVYVEVPDVATLGSRSVSDNILGALHHHLYSPRGLAALIESCGLRVLDVGRTVEPSSKITVFAFACLTEAFHRYVGVEEMS